MLESNARNLAATPLLKAYMFEQSLAEALRDGPRIDDLREAIKANRVSFPTPVPIFPTQFRPDIQWRMVELYFIRGWSSRRLSERYGVTARRIQQSLQHWVGRAVARGYLQAIPSDGFPMAPGIHVRAVAGPPGIPENPPQFVPIPANAASVIAAIIGA